MAYTTEDKKQKDESKFTSDQTDANLITIIEAWRKESLTYHDVLLRGQEKAVKYYEGDQTDKHLIAPFNSDTVHNRIFEATETIVPIITANTHQFIALPSQDSEVSLEKSTRLQIVLTRIYEDWEIQALLEDVVRDICLKRFAVIKWFWDSETDNIGIKVIDPRLILIPKMRLPPDDLPYVMEVQNYTKDELTEAFPDIKIEEFAKEAKINVGTTTDEVKTYQVLEVVSNETTVWYCSGKILDKIDNPYYDFSGEDVEDVIRKVDKKGQTKLTRVKSKRFFNHLDKPTKNFIFFAPFRTGEAPVAPTSLAEVSIPVQDDINTQKRQIVNNLVKMGNGQVLVDKGAIEDELLDNITNEPGLKIVGDGVASENRVRREPGIALPASHFSNLMDSSQAFDNLFGVHPSTRGQGGENTLGGAVLSRNQDLSRVDTITRVLNRGVARLADGVVQLMKMFWTDKKIFRYLDREDAMQFLSFVRDDIEDGVVINVKSGNAFPLDPVSKSNRAIQMWQLQAIDPVTFYEQLGFPNPKESAMKLDAWRKGTLLFESQLRQQEAMVGVAAKAGATAATEGGSGRKVETPANAGQRAEMAVGGTAPVGLPNPPKM